MSCPCRRISPVVGKSKPAISRRSVVLPQPEGPSSVKNSFSRMATETPSSARASPKALATSMTSIAGESGAIPFALPVAARRLCAVWPVFQARQ